MVGKRQVQRSRATSTLCDAKMYIEAPAPAGNRDEQNHMNLLSVDMHETGQVLGFVNEANGASVTHETLALVQTP
jgi:hypothetical protein